MDPIFSSASHSSGPSSTAVSRLCRTHEHTVEMRLRYAQH